MMLDSPLTSYKKKHQYEADVDIQFGFFDSLLNLPDYQHVIVFENKEPPAEVRPRLVKRTSWGHLGWAARASYRSEGPYRPGSARKTSLSRPQLNYH